MNATLKKRKQYKTGQYKEERGTVKINSKVKALATEKKGKSINIGGFFDTAGIHEACDVHENLVRIVDRIEEAQLQDNFPSAYQRAKESLNEVKKIKASM